MIESIFSLHKILIFGFTQIHDKILSFSPWSSIFTTSLFSIAFSTAGWWIDAGSTPKYKANDVKVKTKAEQINERVSIQKIKCESIRSKQKNQRPKSK